MRLETPLYERGALFIISIIRINGDEFDFVRSTEDLHTILCKLDHE